MSLHLVRDSHRPSSSGSCRFCFIRFSPVFFIRFLPDPPYRSSSSVSHRLSPAFFIRLLPVSLPVSVLTGSSFRFSLGTPYPIRRNQKCNFSHSVRITLRHSHPPKPHILRYVPKSPMLAIHLHPKLRPILPLSRL